MAEQKQQEQQAEAVEAGGSLIEQIMMETRLKPEDEGYETAKKGVQAFITDYTGLERSYLS